MPTIAQIRAARALLDWSQSDLADHAGMSQTGVARIENGTNKPNSSTLDKIRIAFDRGDIEFIGETGVKKRTGEIKTYKGQEGFRAFMDDVYETAAKYGGEICIYNVNARNWLKWLGEDKWKEHNQRMQSIKQNITDKIIIKENDWFFLANDFAEYRWLPEDLFNERCFYTYGKKLAFVNFEDDDVTVLVLENEEFSNGFRVLFNVAWDNITIIPPKK